MQTQTRYEPHSEWSEKQIAFPGLSDFNQLFEVIDEPKTWKHGDLSVIGSFLHVKRDNYQSMQVKPSKEVLDWIRDHMISVDYDTIVFQIVVHDDSNALVVAHYGQIIGSRYLAYIDAATIPGAHNV